MAIRLRVTRLKTIAHVEIVACLVAGSVHYYVVDLVAAVQCTGDSVVQCGRYSIHTPQNGIAGLKAVAELLVIAQFILRHMRYSPQSLVAEVKGT